MDKTILQIPITKTLKREAKLAASAYGFSSLQEILRVFLTHLVKKNISVTFTPEVKLSPRAERRYAKMDEDFRLGRNVYKAKDLKSLMKHLHGNSL